MSVEFHVGSKDHHKVEDFLARDHDGVGAISLDAKHGSHQSSLAEVAYAEGVEVLLDPRTDRLEHPGFRLDNLPAYRPEGYDVARLASQLSDRQELTDQVLAAQDGLVSIVTPPYFFGRDERTAHLNLALAEQANLSTDHPVRPVVALRSRTPIDLARQLADEYTRAGFTRVDLRISPLGGGEESIAKIRSAFAIADLFSGNGISVILGMSGNIGQVAYALGRVDGYSVGIGMREKVNMTDDYSRQATPPKFDENGKRVGGGQWEGVYLPGLAMTLKKTRAEALLGHSDIRTRIGSAGSACAESLMGPTTDHRTHYLHSRAAEMALLQNTPEQWRAEAEAKRLRRAFELRELVNREYKSKGESQLPVRTLASLVDGIQETQDADVA